MLEGEGLTKVFGGLTAVSDVRFNVHAGEIVGLIGPNGAGKTTLINMISGLCRCDRGTVRFRGRDITSLRPYRIARMGLARTFQIVRPFPRLTVRENVLIGALYGTRAYRTREALARATEVLEFVGLADKMGQRVADVTQADQKRVELAKALATEPTLLLLDEVMAGLNAKEIEDVMRIVLRIRAAGASILMVEHVMKAIVGVSDRVFVMHQGRKIVEGRPAEVLADDRVIAVYLGSRFTKR
ncbi:MAG: ABC transporter ATP-binding protein [Candidatus Rokubacteria bacterium]|nr:ABC transporter ATP-binding protein [Candidatus Rokubacteria bacterium]